MADVADAFLRGHAAGQAVTQHEQALEENKLRAAILKHQLDALKIEDMHRQYEIKQQHASLQLQAQSGQPASSFATPIPSTGMLPGGQSMPAPSGPSEVVPTGPAPIAFPGLPPELGGSPGFSVTPQTLEQQTRARQQAEIEKSLYSLHEVPPGGSLVMPAVGTIASGTPVRQPNIPLDEQAVTALKAGDQATFDRIMRVKKTMAEVTKDPAQAAQLNALRAIELQLKQAQFEQTKGASGAAALGVSGDAAIAHYAPDQQRVIKLLTEYKMPLPSGFALRSPYWQNILAGAAAYDPSFDASQYNVRLKTRQSFTSGQSAGVVNSLNTAVGHLDTLSQRADELNNFGQGLPGTTAANYLKNIAKTSAGNPAVKNFTTARDAVANELTKVFRGSGGAEADVKGWQQNIDSAGSPEQLHGAIQQAIELMQSRLEALQSQYEKGVGKPADFNFLTPRSQAILQRLGGGTTGVAAPAPAAAPVNPFR